MISVAAMKTGVVVVLVTVLVWVLAESQTVRTDTAEVTVSFVGQELAEGAQVIRAVPGEGWTGTVEVELEGAVGPMADLRDALGQVVSLTLGREVVAPPGQQQIVLRDVLREAEPFRDSGVTIASVTPAQVVVQVDTIRRLELPVRVVLPPGTAIEGQAVTEPATVVLLGPSSAFEAVDRPGALREVVAPIDTEQLGSLVTGRAEQLRGIRLEPPGWLVDRWSTRLSPASVNVELTLRSRTRTITIPTMPVQVTLAPTEQGAWEIRLDPTDQDLIDVVLTGPDEAIGRIERREVRPFATVLLSFEELERGITTKRAEVLGLPPGVEARVDDADVGLTIQRIARPDDLGAAAPQENG